MLAHITKPELTTYYHAALFIPKKKIPLKETKQGFLKTWSGLTEGLIKKNLYKSMNTTMSHQHMKRQGVKSSRKTKPDTNLGENKKLT